MHKLNSISDVFPKAKQFSDSSIYVYGNKAETKFSDKMLDCLFVLEDNSWWFKYRAEVIYNIF